jgi:hypothetical protein
MTFPVEILYETGLTQIEKLNPMHVVRLAMKNPKNVDEGTLIQLRTGETLVSTEPLDQIDIKMDDTAKKYGIAIVSQVSGELGKLIKPKRKTTRKKG